MMYSTTWWERRAGIEGDLRDHKELEDKEGIFAGNSCARMMEDVEARGDKLRSIQEQEQSYFGNWSKMAGKDSLLSFACVARVDGAC
jgi:hypothetical protein